MFFKVKAPVISPNENVEVGGCWFLHSLHSEDVSVCPTVSRKQSPWYDPPAAGGFDSLAGKWLQPFLAELEFSLNSACGSGFVDFYLEGESYSMFSPHTSDTSVGAVQIWDVLSLKTIKPQHMAASLPFTLHSQSWTIFQILFTHNWCVEF